VRRLWGGLEGIGLFIAVSKLGLFPFPQHFAHGFGDDAGKISAEASDIGPDALKAGFNLAQPDFDPGQPCVHFLDLLAGGDGMPPQERHFLLKLSQDLSGPRIVAILPFRVFSSAETRRWRSAI
jgi:hypothetical protein